MMDLLNQTSSGLRAEKAVLAVLPRTARVRAGTGNLAADLTVNGQPLEITWIGDGRLGDVRRLLANRRHRPDVAVARRLSPGARAALSEASIGWVDESGAAEIATGTIVVSRSGVTENQDKRPKGWAPSVLAVAEAALCGIRATASAMREATGLSMGSCVNALRVLTDLGLLEAAAARGRVSARRVDDPDRLLEAYAAAAEGLASDLRLEIAVTWRDLAEGVRSVARPWNSAGVDHAVTGALAAEALAPYLTSVPTAEVYVASDTIVGLEAAAASVSLRPIEGGRLVLRPFPTVSTSRLTGEADGLRVAPWPRVYVDLLHAGVRGEDAAEHLKETMRAR
jgi:hypothetical protein